MAMGCHRPQPAFLSHRWGHFLGISAVGSPIAKGVFGEGWGGSCNWLVLSPSAPTTIPVGTPPPLDFCSVPFSRFPSSRVVRMVRDTHGGEGEVPGVPTSRPGSLFQTQSPPRQAWSPGRKPAEPSLEGGAGVGQAFPAHVAWRRQLGLRGPCGRRAGAWAAERAPSRLPSAPRPGDSGSGEKAWAGRG